MASGRRLFATHTQSSTKQAAGVCVFGGGSDEAVPPVLVSANGTFSAGGYSWAPPLNGCFLVLEIPSREEAIAWAARIAKDSTRTSMWPKTVRRRTFQSLSESKSPSVNDTE